MATRGGGGTSVVVALCTARVSGDRGGGGGHGGQRRLRRWQHSLLCGPHIAATASNLLCTAAAAQARVCTMLAVPRRSHRPRCRRRGGGAASACFWQICGRGLITLRGGMASDAAGGRRVARAVVSARTATSGGNSVTWRAVW